MARRPRVTRLVDRFAIPPGDSRVAQVPFIQNNGNGTFSVSTGAEGIIFSLSDTDLVDLMTGRRRSSRILLEPGPPAEPAVAVQAAGSTKARRTRR